MNTLQIDRRRRLSYDDFARQYLFPGKPVIITGAVDHWNALDSWTPDFFRRTFGNINLLIDGGHFTMADFIDRVESSSPDRPAPYLRNEIIDQFLPELLPDIDPLPRYFFPNWLDGILSRPLRSRLHNGSPELYIGGRGAKFPFLHFDNFHTHAFLTQIYGVKEYTTYSEDQTPYLYVDPRKYNASLIPDLENPDLEKFPLFAKATPMRCFLYPGEILFIPGGLWHTARMLTPSISVSVNRANASNWSTVTHDMWNNAPLPIKPFAAAYLTAIRTFHALRELPHFPTAPEPLSQHHKSFHTA